MTSLRHGVTVQLHGRSIHTAVLLYSGFEVYICIDLDVYFWTRKPPFNQSFYV